MWTGGDVQGGYSTQWALNPSTYQNLPNEQVDWASLAQQWIKMKETFPEPQPQPQVPPAPPPPSIQADIEAGEAPMDVAKDEATPASGSSTNTSQDGSNWGGWGSWQQWGWGWGGPPDSYNPPAVAPPTTTFDYNHGASMPDNFEQGQQGYWSEGPAPFVRNKTAAAEWRSEQAPSRRQSGKVEEVVEPDTTALFDAAKRKQLPAWIREGLEKMEREKQKKLERERQLKEREEELLRQKEEEEEALASGVKIKSKFETDSEESDKEVEPETVTKPQRRSRFDTGSSPVPPKPSAPYSHSPPPVKRKSREELMQEVMQQVRYVLTDILMTVTNEEMRKIAEEVLADFRAKAPASRLRQTPALTSLTGKLGLGIYDSDSEESSAESDERPSKQNGVDSDEELRERIYRKRQEFAKIERDIEHQVEQQEERERERQIEDEEEEEEKQERGKEMGQVEPKPPHPGIRVEVKTEEQKVMTEIKHELNKSRSFTPERVHKEKEISVDRSEVSDSSSKSHSFSSRSSSSSRYKKSRKSLKRKKEKKSSKKKRKRSRSRSSDRRRSHKKSSHSHRYERERSRSRSRSRGHYDDYHRYRRHSSESSHKRRHDSYSRSPDHSRGKRSSHRSRD